MKVQNYPMLNLAMPHNACRPHLKCSQGDSFNINFKSNVVTLTKGIRVDNLRHHIKFLASRHCAGRFPNTKGSELARKYIIKQFQKYGIKPFKKIAQKDYIHSTIFKKVYKGLESNKSIKINSSRLRVNNILGYIPAKSDEYLFVTAHYDHLGRNIDTGRIYSGAEDNASGVAVMLEVARLLSKEKLNKNIVFVATDGEELGCLGAASLAKKLEQVGINKKVQVLNVDSVGAGGSFLTIEGGKGIKGNKVLSDASKEAARSLGVKYRSGPKNFRTDAEALEKNNIPAITYLWMWLNSESNRPFMHTTNDKASVIHYKNVLQTAQVLLNSIFKLSS